MTTRTRRLHVSFGVLSSVALALALTLVVAAATAAQTSQRTQKQRRAGQAPAGQELEAQPPAALEQPSARLLRSVQQPPAARAVAPQRPGTTATPGDVLTDRTGTVRIVRGARRVGIPTIVPPFPGPASPIR